MGISPGNAMVATINSALANGIGNLLSRTLTMIERYCAGTIPERAQRSCRSSKTDLKNCARQLGGADRSRLQYQLPILIGTCCIVIEELNSACDEYIESQHPWKLAKQDGYPSATSDKC